MRIVQLKNLSGGMVGVYTTKRTDLRQISEDFDTAIVQASEKLPGGDPEQWLIDEILENQFGLHRASTTTVYTDKL